VVLRWRVPYRQGADPYAPYSVCQGVLVANRFMAGVVEMRAEGALPDGRYVISGTCPWLQCESPVSLIWTPWPPAGLSPAELKAEMVRPSHPYAVWEWVHGEVPVLSWRIGAEVPGGPMGQRADVLAMENAWTALAQLHVPQDQVVCWGPNLYQPGVLSTHSRYMSRGRLT
jgi:hypothetical protein